MLTTSDADTDADYLNVRHDLDAMQPQLRAGGADVAI